MQFNTLILVLMVLVITACKKDPIPELPENNSPIYYISGTLNGDKLNYSAGIDNMYMKTNFSYFNNVLQYSAKITDENNYFNIEISDAAIDIPSNNIDFTSISALELAKLDIGDLVVLNKEIFSNQDAIEAVSWTIDGELQPSQEISISEPGLYTICARVSFIDGATRELCNELLLGYKKNPAFGLYHTITQGDQLNLYLDIPQTEIKSITWNVNGSQYATSNTISIQIEPETYSIEAIVTLENGVKRVKNIFFDGGAQNHFIEDFSTQENQSVAAFWDLKSRLSIMHLGDEWEPVNFDDKIIINSIKKNELNENKNSTYLLEGIFDGEMINKHTAQIAYGSFKFNLAFAIP